MMSCSDSNTEQNGASPPYWRIVSQAVAPAGQHLVRIGLVADVPEDLVARRVEQAVERDGELAGAEVGAEVAADLADHVDDQLADLLGELPGAASSSRPLQVLGAVDPVQEAGSLRWLVACCSSLMRGGCG